jgi:hypothetical protein
MDGPPPGETTVTLHRRIGTNLSLAELDLHVAFVEQVATAKVVHHQAKVVAILENALMLDEVKVTPPPPNSRERISRSWRIEPKLYLVITVSRQSSSHKLFIHLPFSPNTIDACFPMTSHAQHQSGDCTTEGALD